MTRYDLIQLKRAAIVMSATADALKDAHAKHELKILTSVIVKAARELELTATEN